MRFHKQSKHSEWGVPYFQQSKPKTNQLHFISDFINVNIQIKHKPYPMPDINGMLFKREGYKYAISLD